MDNRQSQPSKQSSLSFEFFWDGFQVQVPFSEYQLSCRFSNIPDKLNRISHNLSQGAQLTAAIFSMFAFKGVQALTHLFADPENKVYYYVYTTNLESVITGLEQGVCNASRTHYYAGNYEEIISVGSIIGHNSVWRNVYNHNTNKPFEDCVAAFLKKEYDEQFHTQLVTLLVPLTAIFGGAMAIGLGFWGYNRFYRNRRPPADIENSENENSENETHDSAQDLLLFQEQNTTLLLPQKKKTVQERLAGIGCPSEAILDDYKDPIFSIVMDDPLVLPDGRSYDRSTIAAFKPDDKCPFDKTKKVGTDHPPNIILKRQIIEFVEEKEKKYEKEKGDRKEHKNEKTDHNSYRMWKCKKEGDIVHFIKDENNNESPFVRRSSARF